MIYFCTDQFILQLILSAYRRTLHHLVQLQVPCFWMLNLLISWTVSDTWGWPFPLIFPGLSILKHHLQARQLVGLLSGLQFYSTDTIRKLYLTIVQPHLEYACEIWEPYLAKDCQMVESVQKFASRVCLKQWSRNTRYQDMFEFLNIPSLAATRGHYKRTLQLQVAYFWMLNLLISWTVSDTWGWPFLLIFPGLSTLPKQGN